jgi:hypothetical protein
MILDRVYFLLVDDRPGVDPTALVSVYGVKQPLIEMGELVSEDPEILPIPVIVVEKRTTPPKEPLTEPRAG